MVRFNVYVFSNIGNGKSMVVYNAERTFTADVVNMDFVNIFLMENVLFRWPLFKMSRLNKIAMRTKNKNLAKCCSKRMTEKNNSFKLC
jgi:hypothetical protein